MASKEINSSFTDQEVHPSKEKNRHFLSRRRLFAQGGAAIALTTALSLIDGAAAQNVEQPNTPTPAPTPPRTEAVKIDGVSIPMPDQQTWQAINALGSVATAGALFLLWRQAKAAEDEAKATSTTSS